jgi:transcriptional regulator with XRE-family HTH domain
MTTEPHPIDVIVGVNLRRLRRRAGLSQTDLGALVGVTFQQIQKYENGKNRISASRLWECARVLEQPIEKFFAPYSNEKIRKSKKLRLTEENSCMGCIDG